MLTMYAHLRGVPPAKINDLVSGTIQHLNLTKWADKLCGDYRQVILLLCLELAVFPFSNISRSGHYFHAIVSKMKLKPDRGLTTRDTLLLTICFIPLRLLLNNLQFTAVETKGNSALLSHWLETLPLYFW